MIEDNTAFQKKYFSDVTPDYKYLLFRETLSSEEQHEGLQALMSRNAEEYIDSRIDKIVIALGDLYYAGIDIQKAWDIVCKSNMSKKRGVKKGREGSGGIDVYKDGDFIPVSHEGNHGNLDEIFNT